MVNKKTAAAIYDVLKKYNLPVDVDYGNEELLKAAGMDKKKSGSSITLVILKNIGTSFLQKTNWQDLPEYIKWS